MFESEEKRLDRLEAERDAKAALTKLRLTLANYGDKPMFQRTLIELVRDCRDALHVVSSALPYLPMNGVESAMEEVSNGNG